MNPNTVLQKNYDITNMFKKISSTQNQHNTTAKPVHGKIMANWKKHNNIISLLGLKPMGEFIKYDDDDNNAKV
jgi:hypothetical protein